MVDINGQVQQETNPVTSDWNKDSQLQSILTRSRDGIEQEEVKLEDILKVNRAKA